MRFRTFLASATALALLVVGCAPGPAQPAGSPKAADGQPRAGGELVFIVSSEPPSFDAHKETTYAVLHPVAPHYSLLLRYDPNDLTKIIPDVAAAMPQISADKLTSTIKLRTDVKFHDDTTMTSEDVLATYNKIIFPPQGVSSPRRGAYAAVDKIEAPDKNAIVFKLKYPSASLTALLASPWNFIYSAAKLKQDIKFYEKNIMGTGPFTHVEYVKGSHWVGKKFADYFDKPKPYLDGYKAVFVLDSAAQVNAIRSKQAMIEFRGFTPTQRDDLKKALGDEITVQEAPWVCALQITPNAKQKPFDDVRVRRALTLAIDRWAGGESLSKITIVKDVGGLMRPKSAFAMSESDLVKVAGFNKDGKAAKEQAKQLLQQAGAANLTFKLLNRNVPTPYEPTAVYVIDQWKQIGLNVTHDVKETAAYFADFRSGNYQVGIDFNCNEFDEPDLQLSKFYSSSGLGKGLNLANVDDTTLDGMITAQSKETDPEKRKRVVWEIERYVMDENAYQFPLIWWYRIIPHNSAVKGWQIGTNHYTNQDLASVWLSR